MSTNFQHPSERNRSKTGGQWPLYGVRLLFAFLVTHSFQSLSQGTMPEQQQLRVTSRTIGTAGKPAELLFPTDDVIPYVPIEIIGEWPENVETVKVVIYGTVSNPSEALVESQAAYLRAFEPSSGMAMPADELIGKDYTTPNKFLSIEFDLAPGKVKPPDAVVNLQEIYDIDQRRKDKASDFKIRLKAPKLRRFYGVEVIMRDSNNKVLYATPGALSAREGANADAAGANGELTNGRIPVFYAGSIEPIPHERIIPYSGVGAGALRIDHKNRYFLTTSVGLIITPLPMYNGLGNPYIHWYGRRPFWSGLANRVFFTGGITAAALNYRGQPLSSTNIKGTVGIGLFAFSGFGICLDYTVGGILNYNPTYDNRTKPFGMPGISVRFTGQLTNIFQQNIGSALPQAK